jgi:hypothetical protein
MSSVIEYVLYPAGSEPVRFRVTLDPFSDTYIFSEDEIAPEWTHLETFKCSHCPLSSEDYELCPLAERLIPFVNKLSHLNSTEELRVDITQYDRTKQMVASVQDILSSLLGLFIATSDCPHTHFLRPMAYFHLPLADADETIYRVMSMYRLAQFFKKVRTGRAYAGFGKLEYLYEQMTEVNHRLSERMRMALKDIDQRQDGTINAIAMLDALSQYVPASLADATEELEPIFMGYWD